VVTSRVWFQKLGILPPQRARPRGRFFCGIFFLRLSLALSPSSSFDPHVTWRVCVCVCVCVFILSSYYMIYMYVCMYVCEYIYVCVCVCVCVYIHTCIYNLHILAPEQARFCDNRFWGTRSLATRFCLLSLVCSKFFFLQKTILCVAAFFCGRFATYSR